MSSIAFSISAIFSSDSPSMTRALGVGAAGARAGAGGALRAPGSSAPALIFGSSS
jgi:hypothetical protein